MDVTTIIMRKLQLIISLLFFTLLSNTASAQVFLQIEKVNSIDNIRLALGDKLQFKTKEYPDVWVKEEINNILPEENTVVLGGNLYDLDAFHQIRIPQSAFARGIGPAFQSFGASWLFFGGMAALFLDYDFTLADGIIGTSAILLGTVFRRIFKRRVFYLGSNARLRIVDLRMVVPEN